VEQVEPSPVAPLLPRPLDQLVERREREPTFVRPAVRLEQQAEEVLGIGVAREPSREVDRRDLAQGRQGRHLGEGPGPNLDRDAEHLAPSLHDGLEEGAIVVEAPEREVAREVDLPQQPPGRVGVEPQGDVGRVTLQRRWDDPPGGDREVDRRDRAERLAVHRMSERATDREIADDRVRVVERDVAGPRGGPRMRIRDGVRHHVGQAWRVADRHHVELVALVRLDRVPDRRSDVPDPLDVAGPSRVRIRAPLDLEMLVAAIGEPERAAHHAALGPGVSVHLDHVPGERSAVGPVHHREEVRGRRDKTELERSVVEGAYADPAGVGVPAEVIVLAVLEHEVDRHRRAGRIRVQHAFDAELHVAGGERRAVGPGQPVPEVEDVAETVVGDLPPIGERGHDRALGPLLHQPVEQLHAELDVGPGDRGARVGVVRQEAGRDLEDRRRGFGRRLRR
jgi:hypothetical protein